MRQPMDLDQQVSARSALRRNMLRILAKRIEAALRDVLKRLPTFNAIRGSDKYAL
jgi:hypothetical protein